MRERFREPVFSASASWAESLLAPYSRPRGNNICLCLCARLMPVLKTSQVGPNSLFTYLKERVRCDLKRLKNRLLMQKAAVVNNTALLLAVTGGQMVSNVELAHVSSSSRAQFSFCFLTNSLCCDYEYVFPHRCLTSEKRAISID